MSAADWPLLDPADEDALHLTRLLSVDERPFQRITKRLLAKDALICRFPAQLPTPPPDATQDSDEAAVSVAQKDGQDQARTRYHDDVLFDFAQLESTLIRIQFLKEANDRERARYAAEKSKILATAESIRANTTELRVQLAEAQKTLALKKEYDELAEAIFKDKALKARDVLDGENDKLRTEIEELEQESRDFGGLWRERKERFDRVVDEGKSLVRFIKGEREEDPAEEDEQAQGGDEVEMKGDSSNMGTPRPDAGGATPMHNTETDGDGALAAQQALAHRALGASLRVSGVDISRSVSPAPSMAAIGQGKDTDMREAGDTPQPQLHSDGMEEGETAEDETAGAEEKMDTT